MVEIRHIRELRMLRRLNLKRNPIQELPDYRLSILFRVSCLTELDRHKVEAEEKVRTCTSRDKSFKNALTHLLGDI